MSPALILLFIGLYFGILLLIAWLTGKNATNNTFFIGEKKSPWFIVAYGMIGASLSGVTFLSVPGWVKDTGFTYFMMVLGYFLGYLVIAKILLPLYYRLNLTSIYSYLEQRFGFWAYKTGSVFFIISRVLGAAVRMFLVVMVLQFFVFDAWNVPFIVTAALFISLILILTYNGGIKTIVYTDTLQTTFMLAAVIITLYVICKDLNINLVGLYEKADIAGYTKLIETNWLKKTHFIKYILSGMFITIVMTGLDQEMMQKNLSCKNIKDAQKNMLTFSAIIVVINLMFLFLGAAMYLYAQEKGITLPDKSDKLFPTLAVNSLGAIAALSFIIGLISAAFPSADGALTSLTTSFSIDLLRVDKRTDWSDDKKIRIRKNVHLGFAMLFLIVIVILNTLNKKAIIDTLFTIAGYTYGPLLGLYAFGLFTKRIPVDRYIPFMAILSPILCYLIELTLKSTFKEYEFGFELLILNGFLMFLFLYLSSLKNKKTISL
ncbi:MAG: sodium:solute symporter [Bacteroidota bacterium]